MSHGDGSPDSLGPMRRTVPVTHPVTREEAVQLPPGHFYIFDLVGLAVYTEDGQHLGRLKEVLQPGANDVYIVEPADGEGEILLPAIKDVVLDVDLLGGRMLVRLLPGMLEG